VNPGSGSGPQRPGTTTAGLAPPPEWLRRTICCGMWEVVHAAAGSTLNDLSVSSSSTLSHPSVSSLTRSSTPTSSVTESYEAPVQLDVRGDARDSNSDPNLKKVVLAISVNAASGPSSNSPDQSPFHTGRYERADGSLVRTWAQRAGIEVIDVDPSITPSATPLPRNHGNSSPEKRRGHPGGLDKRDRRDSKEETLERERKPPLVEKPIAMTIVNDQPVKLLRVLARGEKLDP